ncbi:MAG TPA: class F sortase, partial [candidate division WWE3 bacterium]|nr:class F sortase [candidate division WWE3 bacterium]
MMNKYIYLSLKAFLVACFIFLWLFNSTPKAKAPVITVVDPLILPTEFTHFKNRSFRKALNKMYFAPSAIYIPSIKVKASIEFLGVDKSGVMEAPKNFFNVGWLKYSSKNGQTGNLVISGHYDTTTGAPAIFYNLNKLKPNDIILIYSKTKSNRILTKKYKITKKYLADPKNPLDVRKAFEKTDNPTITLITCNGIWNP